MTSARALIDAFAVHGGRIDLARANFPEVTHWTDLSTGISPWAYPAVTDAGALQRLPEPSTLAGLEAAAAAVFGSDPARTVAVPGSDTGLRLVARLLGEGAPQGLRAAVVGPGYSGHLAMWGDTPVVKVLANAIVAALDCYDVLVLARPNNPDGAIADVAVLEHRADTIRWLVVDEAFVDATPDIGLAGRDWPGLIVLRSFGKFFGLAGLRLGFVIAPEMQATALRQLLGDWPISGLAIAVGTAAYQDLDWQAAQRQRLAQEATQLDKLLSAAGLSIIGGTALFRLVEVPDAAAVFLYLARRGVLTRPFTDNPHRLRIGLPQCEADWVRLANALDQWRPT